jgi:hypothetical protein
MTSSLFFLAILAFLLAGALSLSSAESSTSFLKAKRIIPVDHVWTGSSPRFSILTEGKVQYVAYYDANRQMTVASRSLDSENWQKKKLEDFVEWDSHNFISMALDSEENLHVSGNMHCVPLRYYRTSTPRDIGSLEPVHKMVGKNEDRVTSPYFFKGLKGELFFTYRDGGSGNGVDFVNIYDPCSREWKRYRDIPFLDGEGLMSAYHFWPILDSEGNFHVAWCWRDTPDVITNHDVCYARGVGGLDYWEKGDGTPISLPITIHNADIIDSVGTSSGLMNNVQISLDSQNQPMVSYIKFDPKGRTQLYIMRLEKGRWKRYQTTNWDCRWDFSGFGSIGAKIWFTGPEPWGNKGTLAQTFFNQFISPHIQIRFLDEKTLQPLSEPMRLYPPEMDDISQKELEQWQINWVGLDLQELSRTGNAWVLRWKSMRPNRDQPREIIPPPSKLEVVEMSVAKDFP